ncbi:hypothetical protein TYRP_015101 [Tyrophagus putrescentiae]|nr:hypothetical protein TYRP_015101 [Tyrophagus putrescentiae]
MTGVFYKLTSQCFSKFNFLFLFTLFLVATIISAQSITGSNRSGDLVCDDATEVLIAKTKTVWKNGQHQQIVTPTCVCQPGFTINLKTKKCDPLRSG